MTPRGCRHLLGRGRGGRMRRRTATARRVRGLDALPEPTCRCRAPGVASVRRWSGAGRSVAPRSSPASTGRRPVADPARGARGIRQDHRAEPMGRAGGRRVRLGRRRPGTTTTRVAWPWHIALALQVALPLDAEAAGALGPCHGRPSPGPGRPAGGGRRPCVASVAPSCSCSTTCTRSGRGRRSRWCARCSTRAAGAPGGRGRAHPPRPGSCRTSSPPVAASSWARPTSPSRRRRRARSSSPPARR